jgi:GDP-D-mannose 3',5'-epimerase
MAVAVLGAGGFIGSHLTRALIDGGADVLVVGSREPTGDARREVWEAASGRVVADLREGHVDLLGCSTVFNMAADMGGVGYFSEAQVGPYISNSRITFNVLEMCLSQKVSKAFMSSSACAYPTQLQMTPGVAPRLSEDLLEMGPADQMYGREKLMICALSEHLPFDCRVGILHTVYGDAEASDETRMKFPTAIARKALQARETNRIEVWGDGSQLRSYLWVDDAVAKILRVMDGENYGPVNIGYQGAVSVMDVVRICCEHLAIAPEVITDSNRPSGVLGRDCCNRQFWDRYGLMEPTDYTTGFGRLIDGLDGQQDRSSADGNA